MRIVGRHLGAVIIIGIEQIVFAHPKTASRHVRAVRSARYPIGKPRCSCHVKNVVVKMAAFGPAMPIREKQEVYRVLWPDVNCIVVNQAIFYGTGNVDAPRAVVLADVVAHHRAGVTGAFFGVVSTFVADQEKTTIVVVAVVVLDDRVPAIPIGIEAFAVTLSFRSIGLVVLNHRVVGAPSPDGDVVSLGALIGVGDHVALDQGAVRCNDHDSIAANVVKLIPANNNALTGKPF